MLPRRVAIGHNRLIPALIMRAWTASSSRCSAPRWLRGHWPLSRTRCAMIGRPILTALRRNWPVRSEF